LRTLLAAAADGSNSGSGSPDAAGDAVREFSAYTSVDKWKELDAKVNTYPTTRTFNAIGTADGKFADDIVAAVASVTGPVHVECVNARPSSGGKYTAVRVGPVHVQSADEVVAIYAAVKEAAGARLKWYM
jgi:putative lipoic acid-binding regulatory protein